MAIITPGVKQICSPSPVIFSSYIRKGLDGVKKRTSHVTGVKVKREKTDTVSEVDSEYKLVEILGEMETIVGI